MDSGYLGNTGVCVYEKGRLSPSHPPRNRERTGIEKVDARFPDRGLRNGYGLNPPLSRSLRTVPPLDAQSFSTTENVYRT